MKKSKTLLAIFISVFICYSFSSPERFGKKVINILKSDKIEKIEKFYLKKEDFITLVNKMDPKPPTDQIYKILGAYESGKNNYINTFQDNLKDIDWKLVKIDSINYDYAIALPGKDINIKWPESKNYKLKTTDLVKAKIFVYFHQNNDEHTLIFNMMNFKSKWKFNHMFGAPILK